MIKLLALVVLVTYTNQSISQTPKKSEKVMINGKNMYYEVYGEGDPLIFLHGYTQSSRAWQPYVQDFDDEYEVYLIDLNGHGQSDVFDETLSISTVANDLYELLEYLDPNKFDAIGFSYGGDVLYHLSLIDSGKIDK